MIKMKGSEKKVEWKNFEETIYPMQILAFILRFSIPNNTLTDMRRNINSKFHYGITSIPNNDIEEFKSFYSDDKKGILKLPGGWIKFVRTPDFVKAAWVDETGKHFETWDDWQEIYDVAKQELAKKELPGDFIFSTDRSDFNKELLDVFSQYYDFDEVMALFKSTHHYDERRKLLRERFGSKDMLNITEGNGIYQITFPNSYDMNFNYRDSRRDGWGRVYWGELERYLYDELEMHDVVGQETYTESEILREHIKRWLNREKPKVDEFTKKFREANKKDRLELIKDFCGARSYSGWGSPLHKHEYGLHGGQFDCSKCQIDWRDVDGDHRKVYKWKEVSDMFEEVLNE